MAATPLVAAAVAPRTEHSPADHHRKIMRSRSLSNREQRPPANKKVKLMTSPSQQAPKPEGTAVFADMPRGIVGEGAQTTSSAGQQTKDCTGSAKDAAKIKAIRQTLSEQFDIEILLKHRELRLIEQEIAKTQVCIEQLRRCTLIPYHAEVSLDPVAPGEKSTDTGCPEFAPPHWTITNGPYTRHYQQWLLPDPKFDGYGPEGPPQAVQRGGKSLRSQGMHDSSQSYTVTGRPQRQSAAKVQQRGASATVCTFNRSDGQLVRMECRDCQRSNFSSAQGFINHCRIAHQREYSSHDAAAFDCGVVIDEAIEQPLISPGPTTPLDGPSRNTRQTQPNPFNTPYASFGSSRRSSVMENSSMPDLIIPTTPVPVTPKLVTPRAAPTIGQRKGGGRRAAMTTPKTQDLEKEGLLKRKNISVNLQRMVTEVKSGMINWDDDSGSEAEAGAGDKTRKQGMNVDAPMLDAPVGPGLRGGGVVESAEAENKPSTTIIAMNVAFPRSSGAMRPAVSENASVPPPKGTRVPAVASLQAGPTSKKNGLSFYGRMGLDGACDSGTSSSDEDDGYKSDAEEEMMEVERSPPLSDEGRIPGSVPEPSGLRYGKGPHTLPPLTFQAVSPPVSPTNTREMELVPTIPAHQEQQVTALCQPTPTSPGLSRQVRFVMPSARKVGSNNPGGVLENGLAKMKFANAGTIKKHGGFNGVMEGRRVS
ncbi:unnamed protein product [Tuber melanosporum]|uniref:(Perigord truffle) hypothetical protein n=1 Tax=Tuber melanosporum (strain Mel28) TaxID=656061 RepID=D5GPA1_TUBMM|nr:uncharacterized protein GSTUM_00011770001 [Tuber melanosporum]CAZ86366.1 unnamed protein product [Tuber melanosporum]